MSLWRRIWRQFSQMWQQDRITQEIDEELQFHLEMRIEENLRAGMSRAEAERDARISFGHLGKFRETCRDINGINLIDSLWQDLRFALRMLRKYPTFSLVAILALAIGIGANTAIFSVVDAVMLRPFPYQNAQELVIVGETSSRSRQPEPVAPANFLDWRSDNHVFEQMAAARNWSFNLTNGDYPEMIDGAVVSANLFDVLKIQPLLGRTFLPSEELPGGARVAILREGRWRSSFAGDPNIIGREISLNAEKYTVVGVMPDAVSYPTLVDLWVTPRNLIPEHPQTPNVDATRVRDNKYLRVIARLKKDVDLSAAQAELDTIASRLARDYPATNQETGAMVMPLQEHLFGPIEPSLKVLFVAVGFVLLIACVNVANLLFVRNSTRHKEIAIRNALGASQNRLLRQLLTESLVLAIAGGLVGLLLAVIGLDMLLKLAPHSISFGREISLDLRILGFNLLISLLAGISFGLLPAFQHAKPEINTILKEGSQSCVGNQRQLRVRNLLVVAEIALSMILLIGAGLMVKSFFSLQQIKPGFDTENVLAMAVSLPRTDYPDSDKQIDFYQQAQARIANIAGVEAVGMIMRLPFSGGNSTRNFSIDEQPIDQSKYVANFRVINDDYFRAMGIPLLRGRALSAQDRKNNVQTIVINELLAQRYFGNENPIGRRINIKAADGNQTREIVGVVGNVKHSSLEQPEFPELYLPYTQYSWPSMFIVVRSSLDRAGLVAAIKNEVRTIDQNLPLSSFKTMAELIAISFAGQRFSMLLMTIFALMALGLAVIGIYGVMSYLVSQRTREIGIRMALGAQKRDVIKLVVGQGMALILLGVVIGVVAAAVIMRLMASLLFGVSTLDTTIFVIIPTMLAIVALVACLIPAIRATRIDPLGALRCD